MRFNNSIDEKNNDLLTELEKAGVQIEFEIKNEFKSWAVNSLPKYVIAANNAEPNPEGLAHELLHIKTNILGFLETHVVMRIFSSHNCRFKSSEIPNFQNLLAHLRMFSMFINMGYKAENFLANHGNEFYLKDLFPSSLKYAATYGVLKEIGKKITIDLITDLISIVLCLKYNEIAEPYLTTGKMDRQGLIDEIRPIDEILFDAIYTDVSEWHSSGTFDNINFYNNLNYRLHTLGYPTEENWSNWENEL